MSLAPVRGAGLIVYRQPHRKVIKAIGLTFDKMRGGTRDRDVKIIRHAERAGSLLLGS